MDSVYFAPLIDGRGAHIDLRSTRVRDALFKRSRALTHFRIINPVTCLWMWQNIAELCRARYVCDSSVCPSVRLSRVGIGLKRLTRSRTRCVSLRTQDFSRQR